MGTLPGVPNEPDDEVVALWDLVTEGYLATRERLLGEIARRFELAPASFDILLRLERAPQHRMPMTRLAKEAALSSGGFTKVADRLVAADLIRRLPNPRDRRVTYACLTEHGADVAAQAAKTTADILRETLLGPLGPQATAALADAMRTLRKVNGC